MPPQTGTEPAVLGFMIVELNLEPNYTEVSHSSRNDITTLASYARHVNGQF